MANDYLIRLHQFISRELTAAQDAVEAARLSGKTTVAARYSGRAEALLTARAFLSERFDLDHYRYY